MRDGYINTTTQDNPDRTVDRHGWVRGKARQGRLLIYTHPSTFSFELIVITFHSGANVYSSDFNRRLSSKDIM